MNYLGKQLSNLPYDATTQFNIFEDPLFAIRKQIQNKDYDLDEIMYQRMKKYIRKKILINRFFLIHDDYGNRIVINQKNVDDINLKDSILNLQHGYRNFFLWRHKRFPSICGLEPNFPNEYNYQLGKFIEINGGSASNKNIQQLYKEWLLIGH